MQVHNSPCPWPTLLGCTEEFQTPQPLPANNFRSIPTPKNQDSHPISPCHLPQDWRKGHSFPRREAVWGGEAAPSGQGSWLRKQTPTDPTQLGQTSQGLEIAWSCCFFYKMVGEQLRFERQQNLISKPRSAPDMPCNSRQVNILLWAWFLICKLEIYVSKWLTAFTQSFRKYLLNSYWATRDVLRAGNSHEQMSKPCRVQCCTELLGISCLLLLLLLLMSFVLRSNWN